LRSHGGRVLAKDAEYTVQRLEINQPFPDAPFDFEFPPGTWVDDTTRGRDRMEQYIVREDGGRRPIERQERLRGAEYEDLVVTETGEAKRPRPPRRTNWWFWGGVVVLAVAAGVYLQRRG
jgi:hypothetical protein